MGWLFLLKGLKGEEEFRITQTLIVLLFWSRSLDFRNFLRIDFFQFLFFFFSPYSAPVSARPISHPVGQRRRCPLCIRWRTQTHKQTLNRGRAIDGEEQKTSFLSPTLIPKVSKVIISLRSRNTWQIRLTKLKERGKTKFAFLYTRKRGRCKPSNPIQQHPSSFLAPKPTFSLPDKDAS